MNAPTPELDRYLIHLKQHILSDIRPLDLVFFVDTVFVNINGDSDYINKKKIISNRCLFLTYGHEYFLSADFPQVKVMFYPL